MWQNNDDGGFGGGGFDANNSFGGGTPGPTEKKRSADTIAHVTIKQILDCPEDTLKIGNTEIGTLVILGIVKGVESSSMKTVYTVEDNTGYISVTHWLNADKEISSDAAASIVENTYVHVYGKMRVQNENKFIMAFNIRPLTDLKAITVHRLNVVYTLFKLEQLAQQDADSFMVKQENHMESTMGGSSMFGNNTDNSFGLNPHQLRVYKAVQQCKKEGGASSQDVASALTVKMPQRELDNILEFLVSEGHIYTSTDDNHFLVTDFA